MKAEDVITLLDLTPHPEGGYYRETWRDEPTDGTRGSGTAIFFLLRAGESSRWHRIDATEIWHFYAGAPLELGIVIPATGERQTYRLGSELGSGALPQAIVPRDAWQSARSLGEWSLVGCTVSPAFLFDRFELAPEGCEP